MALKTFAPNQTVYEKGTPVNEVALIIKGSITLDVGDENMIIDVGSVIGLSEPYGATHRYTYISKGETTVYTYKYSGNESIIELLKENEKLAPTITLSLIKNTNSLLRIAERLHESAGLQYEKFLRDLKEYPDLCAKTGSNAKDFSSLKDVKNPDFPMEITHWNANFIKAVASKYKLFSPIYSLGSDVCIGFALNAIEFAKETSNDIEKIHQNLDEFHKATLSFRSEIATLNSEASAIDAGTEEVSMPSTKDSLGQILMFAEYDEVRGRELRHDLDDYLTYENRVDTGNELRALRKRISSHFYTVYKFAFLKSLQESNIPAVVNMFLLFGYMDERLVSEEDLVSLYGFSCAYRYDGGKVISIYDWLKKIYRMETDPSLNEFQQDWPTYLRDLKHNGEIHGEEMDEYMVDPIKRLEFEIKNVFTLGNRMTFGRVSTFIPVFDSQNRMLPLERSHLSSASLLGEIDKIRAIDYSIFYRTKLFVMPNAEKTQLFIHEEQTPYIILFPNVGSNMILWQTIEGRVRNSPGRILAPTFFDDNVSDSIIKVCGEYRWEVCKTDQGVRWTDITDPSLTAEYNDFLQFFKKNNSLSKDQKEKLRGTIKKYSNNFKKVFIGDYVSYIKYESAGNMRLLKQVREILFKYCPFSKDIREKMHTSPQYEKLIEARRIKTEQKTRPLSNIIQKSQNICVVPPQELFDEIDFLEG